MVRWARRGANVSYTRYLYMTSAQEDMARTVGDAR